MKSLVFPIVFALCFVILLAGTKAVPTGETPSLGKSQKKSRFPDNPSEQDETQKSWQRL